MNKETIIKTILAIWFTLAMLQIHIGIILAINLDSLPSFLIGNGIIMGIEGFLAISIFLTEW
jgi:hypothetical protein